MKWLIQGERVIAVTGEQGSGKTTLLMSLIGYINPAYNLRIQEMSFELHLRKIYPVFAWCVNNVNKLAICAI